MGQRDDAPVPAVHRLAVLGRRPLAELPVVRMRLQRLGRGAADGEHAEPVPARRQPARRRARAGHRHFHVRPGEVRHLELRLAELEPVRLHRDALAPQQRHQRVEGLVHHAALLARVDPHAEGVARERPRPDAEHGAPLRHVVKLHHPVGEREGVVVGQRDDAGAEPDMPGALGGGGDEQFRTGDDLEAAGMVLADPDFVVVEPVEMLDQLHIPVETGGRVLVHRVERGEEDSEAERRGHGNSGPSGESPSIMGLKPGIGKTRAHGAAGLRARDGAPGSPAARAPCRQALPPP